MRLYNARSKWPAGCCRGAFWYPGVQSRLPKIFCHSDVCRGVCSEQSCKVRTIQDSRYSTSFGPRSMVDHEIALSTTRRLILMASCKPAPRHHCVVYPIGAAEHMESALCKSTTKWFFKLGCMAISNQRPFAGMEINMRSVPVSWSAASTTGCCILK